MSHKIWFAASRNDNMNIAERGWTKNINARSYGITPGDSKQLSLLFEESLQPIYLRYTRQMDCSNAYKIKVSFVFFLVIFKIVALWQIQEIQKLALHNIQKMA